MVKRSEHDDLYDGLRLRMRQPEGQALYKLRKQTVERQFADETASGLRSSLPLRRADSGRPAGLGTQRSELLKVRSQGQKAEPPHQAG
jgi:hypothetical protein